MPGEMVTESQSEILIYATGCCSDFRKGDRGGYRPGSWMFADREGTNDLALRYLTLGRSKNVGVTASHLSGRRTVGCSAPKCSCSLCPVGGCCRWKVENCLASRGGRVADAVGLHLERGTHSDDNCCLMPCYSCRAGRPDDFATRQSSQTWLYLRQTL